jgi:hypothetical protein
MPGCRESGRVALGARAIWRGETYLEPARAEAIEASTAYTSAETAAAHAALENMLRQCNAFCMRAGRGKSSEVVVTANDAGVTTAKAVAPGPSEIKCVTPKKTESTGSGAVVSEVTAAIAAAKSDTGTTNGACKLLDKEFQCRAFALPPAGRKTLPGAGGRTMPWRNWSGNTRRIYCWRSLQKISRETSWNSESTRDGGSIFCGRLRKRSGCAEGFMDSTVLKDYPSHIQNTARRSEKKGNTPAGWSK